MGRVGPEGFFGGVEEGGGVRSHGGPGAVRTIILFVYARTNKRHHHHTAVRVLKE